MKTVHPPKKPKAILFDLDGTLLDSAPDLVYAINTVRQLHGLPTMPYELLRPYASGGAPGLIGEAFHLTSQSALYPELRKEFLKCYMNNIVVYTKLFDGMATFLQWLTKHNIKYGIVTNKATNLTNLVIERIKLENLSCIICGDTTAHPKPFPDPVLEAAKRISTDPADIWFIGDDLRDIQAGKAAGTVTVAAQWGYGKDMSQWQANLLAKNPEQLQTIIESLS